MQNDGKKRKRTGGGSGFSSSGKRSPADKKAALKAANALVASFSSRSIVMYSDGACSPNPGPAGGGALVTCPESMIPTIRAGLSQVAVPASVVKYVPPPTPSAVAAKATDASTDKRTVAMPAVLAAMQQDGRTMHCLHESIGWGTNQTGELSGAALALEFVFEHRVQILASKCASVELLTDSTYTRGLLVDGWSASTNHAEVDRARTALRKCRAALAPIEVTLHWVAGHVGLAGNEAADHLAGKGIEESRARLSADELVKLKAVEERRRGSRSRYSGSKSKNKKQKKKK